MTEMNRHHWENETETFKQMTKTIPLGRAAEAREITELYYSLASDNASYITGTDIIADGGFLLTGPRRA